MKKYKVFCVTENKFVEVWKLTTPDCCPNNNRHIIDDSQTQQIDQKFTETDKIQHVNINSKNFRNTNGIYCGEGRSYVIPANVSVHVENIEVKVPMCVFGMRFCVRDEHYGDSVSFIGQPETVAGVVIQTIDVQSTTIFVNETVVQNVVPGYHVVINGEERQVIGVDSATSSITVDTPFSSPHAAMSYVMVNVYVVKNYRLDAPGIFEVGYGAFGGKVIPQDAVLRMIYTKADPSTSKKFSFNVEYMY